MSQKILELRVVECRDLHNHCKVSTPDPYVLVHMDGKRRMMTEPAKDSLNPQYNALMKFEVFDPAKDIVHVEVFDKNRMKKDVLMGHINFSLGTLTEGEVVDKWYLLRGATSGEIRVRFRAQGFGAKDENSLAAMLAMDV